MVDSFKNRGGRQALLLGLVVLSIALRLLGPATGLPAKDGYVPICTGSKIIYLSLAEAGLAAPAGEEEPAPPADRCPWFAQFHAIETSFGPAAEAFELRAIAVPLPLHDVPVLREVSDAFQARAPPTRGS